MPTLAPAPACLIDEDNWETVQLFLRLGTQWKQGGFGGVIGLDYPGVKAVLDLTVPKQRRAAVFEALQVMEWAALAAINKRVNK